MNSKQRKAEEKARKAGRTEQEKALTPEQTARIEKGMAVILGAAPTPKVTKSGLPAMPRLPRARKPKPAQDCSCGCGGQTRGGRFIPGHDSRLKGWLLRVERKVVTLDQIPEGEREAVKRHLAAVQG